MTIPNDQNLKPLRWEFFAGDELAAYARAMPPGMQTLEHGSTIFGSEPVTTLPIRIGRVVIAQPFRGKGLATRLMQQLMSHLEMRFPDLDYALAAQASVQEFYAALGFEPVSDVYLEDGIPHVDMVRLNATLGTSSPTSDA